MGVTATTRLPAGWYPDPEGDNQRRWWDGHEWTQYTAEFQRPTSVDDVVITSITDARGEGRNKARTKARRTTVAKVDTTPGPEAKKVDNTAAQTAEPSPTDGRRASAERLGRLLAGVSYALPSLGRSSKRHGRRARRKRT